MSTLLNDLLTNTFTEPVIDQLHQQIGSDRAKTAVATSTIYKTLISALGRNASTPEGAQALSNALEQNHEGSILDILSEVIKGELELENKVTLNNIILDNILGKKLNVVIDMISKMSGLPQRKVQELMELIAPISMSVLGKIKKEYGLDISGLSDLLITTVIDWRHNHQIDLIEKILDQDGDGSIMDDLAGFGMSAFKDQIKSGSKKSNPFGSKTGSKRSSSKKTGAPAPFKDRGKPR